MLLAAGLLVAVLLADWLYAQFAWKQQPARAVSFASGGKHRTSIVFPGLANPVDVLSQGMRCVLGDLGPMIVVDYGTSMTLQSIFAETMKELAKHGSHQQILVYGHSMGGMVGNLFRQWYDQQNCPYGPIRELLLDCSPGTIRSVGQSYPLAKMVDLLLRFYAGGPILAVLVAGLNILSRIQMPAPRSAGSDPELYRRYAKGMMWYNIRAWVVQMRFMLRHTMPQEQVETPVRSAYLCATDPSRDKLVNQRVARAEWEQVFPCLETWCDPAIGHAWPMEQPEAYRRLVRWVLGLCV